MGLIYLDACLLIYLVEQDVVWAKPVAEAMAGAVNAHYAISPLVKMECLVGPARHGDLVRERAFNRLFETVVLLDMPDEVYLQAAQLRGRFGLRTPDALQLACAQHHRCDALWTNDERLHQASYGLAQMILKP
ncbi:MAG: type II toxin-antitoxin system VapC family toxin [Rhodanobacter sp.]